VSGARIAVLPDRLNNYILFRGIVKDFLRKKVGIFEKKGGNFVSYKHVLERAVGSLNEFFSLKNNRMDYLPSGVMNTLPNDF